MSLKYPLLQMTIYWVPVRTRWKPRLLTSALSATNVVFRSVAATSRRTMLPLLTAPAANKSLIQAFISLPASPEPCYPGNMPKRSSKPADPNRAAFAILNEATDETETEAAPFKRDRKAYVEKNPAAVELGRRGGLKGGAARREALSPEQRIASAKKAAEARWGPRTADGEKT